MTSLITCTYNRASQLRWGLESVISQDVLPDEIIVVDDGSSDNTEQVVQELNRIYKLGIRYIYLNYPEPRISCIPRNMGWKAAKGDVIIFTEPEGLHIGNTIKQLTKAMKENPDNTILASQVWTIGERIYQKLTDGDLLHPERIINHEYAQMTDNEHPNNIKAPDSDFAITGEANCNAGVLFATRKAWLEKVGGFDESFEGHGWDDLDLFNRLALAGHGIIKFPDIAIIHQWHDKSFYKYNIYEMADRNGKISEANCKAGRYKVNE